MSIRINKEFESLIPPLTPEEFKQLEENCVKEGIRDPLVVWHVPNGDDILIDGHNRWKIAAKHAGIPFDIKRMEFKSYDDVKLWIIDNQLGKRNLQTYDKGVLELKKKEILHKLSHQGHRSDLTSVQNWTKVDALKTMGENAGISRSQMAKIQAIEISGDEDIKQQVRTGDMSIHQGYLAVRDKSPRKLKQEFVDQARQEHEDFLDQKGDGVVSVKNAVKDKQNKETLTRELWLSLMKAIKAFNAIELAIRENDMILDLDEFRDSLKPDDKALLVQGLNQTVLTIYHVIGEVTP